MTPFEKVQCLMSVVLSLPTLHNFLATLARVGAFALVLLAVPGYAKTGATVKDDSIRHFNIKIPESELVDLRRRIAATKRPEREAVSDATQGVQLATLSSPITHLDTENHSRKE
jgi:Epoxide hydrolase N terminus